MKQTETLIQLKDIQVRYEEKVALKKISLSIPKSRVTVLIGPSGCGKSTTLKTINRLVSLHGGEIHMEGVDIQSMDVIQLRRSIGYAIQSVGLFPHMTVKDNIALVPRLLGWSKERQESRVEELLDLIGLPRDYKDRYPNQLSGGESQRVGVARALGANPPILLLDEPFGAVDPLNREVLQDEFIRIQRRLKKTVVFVTHDLDEAVRLADYLVILKDGEIQQADSPAEILANPVSDFVTQFLGADRALKRLNLFTVDLFAKAALKKEKDIPPKEEGVLYWEVARDGKPLRGELKTKEGILTRVIDLEAHTVKPYSSLKESLSRIIALGLPAAPVVGENNELIGEIRYEAIENISIQK